MTTIKSSPIAANIGHLPDDAKQKAITKYLSLSPHLGDNADMAFHEMRTKGFIFTLDGNFCYVHAIGFESHTGIEYLFNQRDQRYDNADKIDLIRDGFKYADPILSDAKRVFKQEGCIGEIVQMLLSIWTPETDADTVQDDQVPQFPNGFDSWQETHFEVVSYIGTLRMEVNEGLVKETEDTEGTGGLYELAKALTDEFESLNAGRNWDGDFFDEIESFLNSKNL